MLVERFGLALKLAPKLDCFFSSFFTVGVVTFDADASAVACWIEKRLFRGDASLRNEPTIPIRAADCESELGLSAVFMVGLFLWSGSPRVEALDRTLVMVRWLWILLRLAAATKT